MVVPTAQRARPSIRPHLDPADPAGPDDEADDGAEGGRRRRIRARWWIAGGVVVLLVVWSALAVRSVLAAREAAQDAIDRIEQHTRADPAALSPADLDRVERDLAVAVDRLRDARRHAGAPWLRIARPLPLVGTQVDALTSLATAGSDIASAGQRAFERLRPLVEERPSAPEGRVEMVSDLRRVADDMLATVSGADLGPERGLLGPLHTARDRLHGELVELEVRLREASEVLAGLETLLEGPRAYVLFAANNAEMRAGSGMFLQAGTLEIADGHFDLDRLQPSGPLLLDQSAAVPLDPDVADHWGWAEPGRDLRNLGFTPRFDVTAAQAARMWEAVDGTPADGVVAVDLVAVQRLVEVVGSIEIDGTSLDADRVVPFLIRDQYDEFAATPDGRIARRERLGEFVEALIHALETREWDPVEMAGELAELRSSRHLLMWSDHPVEQRAYERAGLAGTLGSDSLMVSAVNRNGTKVDQFVELDASLRLGGDPPHSGSLVVTLENRTPEDEPRYVTGPHPLSDDPPGRWAGVVTVHLPPGTSVETVEGGDRPALAGHDGDWPVVGRWLELDRDETARIRVDFRAPDGMTSIRIEPSARVPPIRWDTDGVTPSVAVDAPRFPGR